MVGERVAGIIHDSSLVPRGRATGIATTAACGIAGKNQPGIIGIKRLSAGLRGIACGRMRHDDGLHLPCRKVATGGIDRGNREAPAVDDGHAA